MSKSVKIKRYGGTAKRNKPGNLPKKLKTIGFIAGAVFVVFIGYSVAAGINAAFFKSNNTSEVPKPPAASEVSTAESEEPSTVNVSKTPLKSLTVSLEKLFATEDGKDDVLLDIKNGGYNSIVLELKDRNGFIRYNSAVPEATEWKAIKEGVTVETLAAFVKELKAQKISAVAKIYAFEDNASQAPNNTTNTTNFIMNGARWYDNDPGAGGKRWLDPNKPAAQKYIIDLAKEISAMGFDSILVQSAHYPNLKNMSAAVLDLGGKTRPQILTEFAEALLKAVPIAQLAFDASALTAPADSPPYFANPAILGYRAVMAEKGFDVFTLDKEKILTIISNDDTLLSTAAEQGFSTIKQ